MCVFHRFHGRAQVIDMPHQYVGAPFSQINSEEVCTPAASARRRPVKHRPHLQTILHRPPGLFHPLLLFVPQRHVFNRERVIVAMHHELAVKVLQVGHRLAVNCQTLQGVSENCALKVSKLGLNTLHLSR